MKKENPTNTSELAGKDPVNSSPRGTLDMQRFKQDLSSLDGMDTTHNISWKEMKALKKSKYNLIKDDFNKAFVMKNKKTNSIVEIQASSPKHACQFIGWRPRHVQVIEIIDLTSSNE